MNYEIKEYFDRDVNAVFCMCLILLFMCQNNGQRPKAFRTKTTSTVDNEQQLNTV